jgi:hypothetical protein
LKRSQGPRCKIFEFTGILNYFTIENPVDRVHHPWTGHGTGPWWIQGGGGQEAHQSMSSPALLSPKARRGWCNRESSLWGSLPAAQTGGGGAVTGQRWEGTISGGGAQRRGDWSTDGVSCETKWEQGMMGEPMVAFIGSQREESR